MRDHKQNEIANYVAFREGKREERRGREMGMTDEGALLASERACTRGDQTYHTNEPELLLLLLPLL